MSDVTLHPKAFFTGAAVHPREPWLATSSMTPSGEGEGQVVVWDLVSGQPVSAYLGDNGFGFESDPDAILWAPTGRRLAVSESTNGIEVLQDGQSLTRALPDDTRDSQVGFCWLGDASRLYASAGAGPAGTGNGTIIKAGAPEGALTWTSSGVPPSGLKRLRYNAAIGAVVGDDLLFLTAVDVSRGTLRYHVALASALPHPADASPVAWSADGRRVAFAPLPNEEHRRGWDGKPIVVTIFDGDDGHERGRVAIEGTVHALRWSAPPGHGDPYRLAIVAGPGPGAEGQIPNRVHVLVADRLVRTIEAPVARVPDFDAQAVDWSPSGDALALLLRDGTIRIVEAASGRTITAFDPVPRLVQHGLEARGLLWGRVDRLIGLSPRRLSIWTTAGERIAHHEVKAPPK